jgi:hypothetical protein
MPAASRARVTAAAAALTAASVIVVTPTFFRAAVQPTVSTDTLLVDSSIFNIPFNLFQDIVNIPYNEVQALDTLANSFFFTGNWFVVSATNLWGVDPGDPSHFMSVADLLLPFPELSGLGAPATDFDAGLGQQLWGLVAAELPVNAACDAASCIPTVPTSPITGITQIDSLIWLEQELTGGQQFPLINNWFQIPISDLQNGYTFDPSAPGSVDPSGPVVSGFGLEGTGLDNAMPWSGDTFTYQPWVPFENFINSLMATPDLNGFEFPTLTEVFQAFQAVIAGAIVDFDPITPGSPFCAGDCSSLPEFLNYPALVQGISNLMPGNPIIEQWLDAYADGAGVAGIDYNGPTEEQIHNSINILQQGFWDFGNPSPPAGTGPDFSELTAFFHQLWTDLGFQPGEGVAAAATEPAAALASSVDPSQLSADLSALLTSFEPAQLSTDLSTLFESFASALSADLATTLPSNLLGLF